MSKSMDIYNRGQWGKDESLSGAWECQNDKLSYEGFEKYSCLVVGSEHDCHVMAYQAIDTSTSKYQFFVLLGTASHVWDILVADLASLLMLIKEYSPVLEDMRWKEQFEMQEEEHKWKAKNLESYEYRKNCGHV